MAKRLKKAPKPSTGRQRTPKPKSFFLRAGTPHERLDARGFTSESACRDAAMAILREREPWCEIYNKAGVEAIRDAVKKVDEMIFATNVTKEILCCFDEYTGMTIKLEMWMVPT